MSATGLDVFDKTLQTTHIWLDEMMAKLGPDRQVAWHVLGAVLHALRESSSDRACGPSRRAIAAPGARTLLRSVAPERADAQATLGGAIPGARVAAAQGHTSYVADATQVDRKSVV